MCKLAQPSMLVEFLMCFSLKSNLRVIGKLSAASTNQHLQTQETAANGPASTDTGTSDIKVIHGLRTLSMVWIIFGHTIGLVNPEMMSKYYRVAPYYVATLDRERMLTTPTLMMMTTRQSSSMTRIESVFPLLHTK